MERQCTSQEHKDKIQKFTGDFCNFLYVCYNSVKSSGVYDKSAFVNQKAVFSRLSLNKCKIPILERIS
jgi:hypothetical protein